jgi:hypothetical protein
VNVRAWVGYEVMRHNLVAYRDEFARDCSTTGTWLPDDPRERLDLE